MSRRRRAVAALVAVPLAVGCAATRDAQTTKANTVSDAASANLGRLQVRNVSVAAPESSRYDAGDDAPLYLTVANSSDSADLLTAVSSDDARSVVVASGSTASASPSPTDSASPFPTDSASPTPIGAGGAPATSFPLAVPASSALMLGAGTTHLVLQGLTRRVWPAQSVRVTLTFADAGSTTLTVPVGLPEDATSTH